MDGRDIEPENDKGFLNQVIEHWKHTAGAVATDIDRYFAMDCNNNSDCIKIVYAMLRQGKGKQSSDMVRAIQESYDEWVTN